MVCERCGMEIRNPGRRFCPTCGSALLPQHLSYTKSWSTAEHNATATAYQQGHHGHNQTSWQQSDQDRKWDQSNHHGSSSYIPPIQPAYVVSTKNDGALITEFILSLFGIFGVGWLIGKETRVGIILLVASIVIYWPFLLLGTVITFGLGLICLGPLAIAAIIVNILLLNQRLKKKALHFVVTPPPGMPPQHMPPLTRN